LSKPADHSIGIFVRNAWILLGFQLVAAAAALAVTAWAALQVRPLLAERERLEMLIIEANARVQQLSTEGERLAKSIIEAEARVQQLSADEERARETVSMLEKRTAALRLELQGARDATPVLTAAIKAFHNKQYALAIVKYDEALKLNPGDPYIYNLKSYSQFKAGDLHGAIDTLSRALQMDPSYDWGYFDLARYQCAAGSPAAALSTITGALELRGQRIQSAIDFFLSKDGEFRKLCADIVGDLRKLKE
jgi:tetratricopeptide (TPR) repeat protein